MSDFERTTRTVEDHSILITSWYDDGKKNWRASAPNYSYMGSVASPAPNACASRKVAIDHLCHVLRTHFLDRTK